MSTKVPFYGGLAVRSTPVTFSKFLHFHPRKSFAYRYHKDPDTQMISPLTPIRTQLWHEFYDLKFNTGTNAA